MPESQRSIDRCLNKPEMGWYLDQPAAGQCFASVHASLVTWPKSSRMSRDVAVAVVAAVVVVVVAAIIAAV